jgi:hypothetical protein
MTALVVGVALASSLVAGCGEKDDAEKEVRAAIRRTARTAHRFVYSESFGQEKTSVRGLVEDDFRFQAQVSINGVPVLEQVLRDDAAAVRMLEPAGLTRFVEGADATALARGQQRPAGVTSVGVPEALTGGDWVLDPSGAPPLTLGGNERHPAGDDPVYDARSALDYTLAAVEEAFFIVRFNPESLYYRASEDPFPAPRRRSGVVRYDVIPEDLPIPGAGNTPGGRDDRPATRHFRKMAVYVNDGRVIEVREQVGTTPRLARRFLGIARRILRESDESLVRELDRELAKLPEARRGQFLLDGYNFALQQGGDPPIRQRVMILQLLDFGKNITVQLPTDNVIGGELDAFKNLGKSGPSEAAEGRASGQAGQATPPSDTPTSTTVAP